MISIIGVRFKKPGKIYFFDPKGKTVEKGMHVIVETAMGKEYGEVVITNRELQEKDIVAPLKPIIRIATEKDKEKHEENIKQEKEAFKWCEEKIKEHKLDMTLVDVEYKFDRSKLLFFWPNAFTMKALKVKKAGLSCVAKSFGFDKVFPS